MIKFHPHLIMVFFQSSPGQEKEFKHSVTEFTVKPSFFIEALISTPHLDGLDQQASASAMQISSPLNVNTQQASSLMVKSAVISIRWSASPSASAAVEFSSQELTVMLIPRDSRQSSAQGIIGIDQPQCGQEWFRELSVRAAHSHAHHFVRPQSEITITVLSRERVKAQMSPHGLTWLKSKASVASGLCTFRRDHHLIDVASSPKIWITDVFISLPLRDFGFSSPVIVIVKIHFDI